MPFMIIFLDGTEKACNSITNTGAYAFNWNEKKCISNFPFKIV